MHFLRLAVALDALPDLVVDLADRHAAWPFPLVGILLAHRWKVA